METELFPDEMIADLFRRPTRTVRRQCRACNLTYVVALDYDGPPLCDGCRADVEATRGRIERNLAAILAGMDEAIAEFDDHVPAYWPYWDRIQTAQVMVDAGEMTEAQFKARWEARKAEGGSWRTIIEYAEARDRALAALGAERARLERALEVLDETL